MAGEFHFYVLGLVFFSGGLAMCCLAVMRGLLLIPGLTGLVFVIWGAFLVEGVTWKDFKDWLFHWTR